MDTQVTEREIKSTRKKLKRVLTIYKDIYSKKWVDLELPQIPYWKSQGKVIK